MSFWFHRQAGRKTSLLAVTNLLPLVLVTPLAVIVLIQMLQMLLSSR